MIRYAKSPLPNEFTEQMFPIVMELGWNSTDEDILQVMSIVLLIIIMGKHAYLDWLERSRVLEAVYFQGLRSHYSMARCKWKIRIGLCYSLCGQVASIIYSFTISLCRRLDHYIDSKGWQQYRWCSPWVAQCRSCSFAIHRLPAICTGKVMLQVYFLFEYCYLSNANERSLSSWCLLIWSFSNKILCINSCATQLSMARAVSRFWCKCGATTLIPSPATIRSKSGTH